MEHPLQKLWAQPSRLVVGLMSGTSADGVDAVLTEITGSGLDTRVRQLGFFFLPFDSQTRQEILDIAGGETGGTTDPGTGGGTTDPGGTTEPETPPPDDPEA